MRDARVPRIRRKVELGERLSDDDFETLKAAAASEEGSALKLAVAHALSNAEEDVEALELLSRLRRDFPREAGVELGYARALVGLERYRDAEVALHNALTLNPKDPETLKSLAAVSLRRGEVERAQSYVEAALKEDPLDDEAQLLSAEVKSAHGPTSVRGEQKALRQEFVEALLRALEARQVHVVRQGKLLFVKLSSGKLGRLDLAALHAAYLEESEALEQTVSAMAAELAQTSDVPRDPGALFSRTRPVLRPSDFEQKAQGSARREGPAGLAIFYVLDDPDLLRYLPESAPRELGTSLAELDDAAWRHLEGAPTEPRPVIVDRGEPRLSPDALGLFALCEADGYDAARVLCASQQARIATVVGQGPYRVALGRRELVLICREDDALALTMLSRLSPGDDGIEGEFVLREGKLEAMSAG